MNYDSLEFEEEESMRYGNIRPPKKGWRGKKMAAVIKWFLTLAFILGVFSALAFLLGCPKPHPQPPAKVTCANVQCPSGTHCEQPPGSDVTCVADAKPPAEEPPPTKPPVLEPFCTKGHLAARFHPYLQGIDATWVCVGDHDFAESVGQGWWPDGTPRYDAPLGPDLSDIRNQREATLGCPAVFWSATRDGEFRRCRSTPNPNGMSCDHWDLHNVPPYGCEPDTGFFSIPQGRGFLKVCSLKQPDVCSDVQFYEQQ